MILRFAYWGVLYFRIVHNTYDPTLSLNQSAFAFGKILNEKYFFSEVKLLKTLRDVKKVAQLICYDVLYSQVKDT